MGHGHHGNAVEVLATPPETRLARGVVKTSRDYHLDNTIAKVIAVGSSFHDDDDDGEDIASLTVHLPDNPTVGQTHLLVAAGAAINVDGGCFDVCGSPFVALCSSQWFTFADNKIKRDCGCGCESCHCPKGLWVSGDGSAPNVAAVVDDPASLTTDIDVEDYADGTAFLVQSNGQTYVYSATSTATVNGSTVVATNTGVGRFIQVPSSYAAIFVSLVNGGLLPPLTPPV